MGTQEQRYSCSKEDWHSIVKTEISSYVFTYIATFFMKMLQEVKIEQITPANYSWVQNLAGLCRVLPGKEAEKLIQEGIATTAKEDDVITQFIRFNALPWKGRIFLPGNTHWQKNQGYTHMTESLRLGLERIGVEFTNSLAKDTDCMLVIDSVWRCAVRGNLTNLKQLAQKNNLKLGVLTMFETDTWLPEFIEQLQEADFIIVPNKWNKQCLKRQGIKNKIYVIPLPNPIPKKEMHRPLKRDTFVFYHYNAMDRRKGFPYYIDAFLEEFKNETDVKLILKSREFDSNNKNADTVQLQNKKIEWVKKDLDHQEMLILHESADCFVFPSKGEGWGYPPIEALLTGNPVIIPNEHGHKEWFTKGCVEIKTEMELASFQINGETQTEVGNWYKPDKESLKKQMRWIYEEWKREGRNALVFEQAKQGANIIEKLYSPVAVAKKIIDVLAKENIMSYAKTTENGKKSRGRPPKARK